MPKNKIQLKCLNCGDQKASVFHEIFDDIGIELQLHKFLEQFFRLQILPEPGATKQQVLCDDCINQLIELIDLEECSREDYNSIEANDNVTEYCKPKNDGSDNGAEDQMTIYEDEDAFVSENREHEEYDIAQTYLKESNEVHSSDVVNTVDIDSYLDASINVDLTNFEIAWNYECKLCNIPLLNYKESLQHMEEFHSLACTFCEQITGFNDLKVLARHLILVHADFSSLQIYANCPYCHISFSDFGEFNKHSCSRRLLKWEPGIKIHCDDCAMPFCSFKRYLFHHQFHLSAHRPKVCFICNVNYSDSNALFEHVNYEHKTDSTFSCRLCDKTFKEEDVFIAHSKSHLTSKYNCGKCHLEFGHRHLYLNHLQTYHTENPQKRACKICGEQFSTKHKYLKHIRQQHVSKTTVKVYFCSNCGMIGRDKDELLTHIEASNGYCDGATVDEDTIATAYTCEYCSKDFKFPNDLKLHRLIGTHQNGLTTCIFCPKFFPSRKKMFQHVRIHSEYDDWLANFPLLRLFVCDVEDCEATFSNWSALNYHKRRNHNPFTCNQCKITFTTIAELDNHQSTCSTSFKCQCCGKLCTTKMALAVHVARRHNNKNVNCPHCNSTYKNDELLQKHIDFMHVAQECTHCHKVVKNKRNLKIHWRVVHKCEHRYFCSECKKGFYHRNDMEAHQKTIHSGVEYRCTECLFTTMYAKSYDIHIAMHKSELKFVCPICGRKFARKQVMNVHIKRHQVDRPFLCSDYILNGCSSSFISHYLLNKHITEKHNQATRKRRLHEKEVLLIKNRKQTGEGMNDFDCEFFLIDGDDPPETVTTELNSTLEVS